MDGYVSFEQCDHISIPKCHHLHNWLSPLKLDSHLEANFEFWSSIAWKNKKFLFEDRVYGIPPAFGGVVCSRCCQCSPDTSWLPEFFKPKSSSLDSFAKRLRETGKGRKLFATEVSLGFGPNLMRTGDSVWLLESQRVPFILRAHGYGAYDTYDAYDAYDVYDAYDACDAYNAYDAYNAHKRYRTPIFELIGACYLHDAARDHDLCAKCGAEVPRLPSKWQTINIT